MLTATVLTATADMVAAVDTLITAAADMPTAGVLRSHAAQCAILAVVIGTATMAPILTGACGKFCKTR